MSKITLTCAAVPKKGKNKAEPERTEQLEGITSFYSLQMATIDNKFCSGNKTAAVYDTQGGEITDEASFKQVISSGCTQLTITKPKSGGWVAVPVQVPVEAAPQEVDNKEESKIEEKVEQEPATEEEVQLIDIPESPVKADPAVVEETQIQSEDEERKTDHVEHEAPIYTCHVGDPDSCKPGDEHFMQIDQATAKSIECHYEHGENAKKTKLGSCQKPFCAALHEDQSDSSSCSDFSDHEGHYGITELEPVTFTVNTNSNYQDLFQEHKALQANYKALQEQNQKLEPVLPEAEKAPEASSPQNVESSSEELEEWKKENAKLMVNIDERNSEVDDLNAKITELTDNLKSENGLKIELQQKYDQGQVGYEKAKEGLVKTNLKLRDAEAAALVAKTDSKKIQEAQDSLKRELESSKQKLAAAQEENQAQANVEALEKKNDEVNQCKAALESLQKEQVKKSEVLAQLTTKVQDLLRTKQENDILKVMLGEALEVASDANKKFKEASRQAQLLSNENAAQKLTIDARVNDQQNAIPVDKQVLEELEDRLLEAECSKSLMREQLEKYEQTIENGQLKSITETQTEFAQQLVSCLPTLKEMVSQIEKAEHDRKVNQIPQEDPSAVADKPDYDCELISVSHESPFMMTQGQELIYSMTVKNTGSKPWQDTSVIWNELNNGQSTWVGDFKPDQIVTVDFDVGATVAQVISGQRPGLEDLEFPTTIFMANQQGFNETKLLSNLKIVLCKPQEPESEEEPIAKDTQQLLEPLEDSDDEEFEFGGVGGPVVSTSTGKTIKQLAEDRETEELIAKINEMTEYLNQNGGLPDPEDEEEREEGEEQNFDKGAETQEGSVSWNDKVVVVQDYVPMIKSPNPQQKEAQRQDKNHFNLFAVDGIMEEYLLLACLMKDTGRVITFDQVYELGKNDHIDCGCYKQLLERVRQMI